MRLNPLEKHFKIPRDLSWKHDVKTVGKMIELTCHGEKIADTYQVLFSPIYVNFSNLFLKTHAAFSHEQVTHITSA